MAENEVIAPETGPAVDQKTSSQILDGILESAIGGESQDNGERPTPENNAVGEQEAEQVEVQADPSDDTAEML